MFRKLCGDDSLKNVILATTKWGIPPNSDELTREQDLCSNDDFWRLMIKDGSLVRRFEYTEGSAQCLVEEILRTGKERFTPKIQHEVVELGKKLSDTDAGASIDEALVELAKKYQEDLKALMEEQDRALRKQDRVMQIALEKAREDLERKVAMKEEEQRILHLDEIEALRKEFEDGAFVNRQGFWHLSWRCLLCMTKLDDGDRWICSYCKLVSLNIG